MNVSNSIIGKILFYVYSQFDCNNSDVFNSTLCTIKTRRAIMILAFLRELYNLRDCVMKVLDMNVDEVQDVLHM